MKIEDMREAIKSVYSGPAWMYRVDAMDERQVVAVYNDFLERNMFEKAKKARKMKEEGHQITIWEYLMKENTNDE